MEATHTPLATATFLVDVEVAGSYLLAECDGSK